MHTKPAGSALVTRGSFLTPASVLLLLLILVAQLYFSVRQESQTWDEGDHIFAGYMSWKRADFGLNPEHPPLVKLLATAPLLGLRLRVPAVRNRFFKTEAFADGMDFVGWNDPDRMLIMVRMSSALLTVLLALLAYLAGRQMFGYAAGFLALAILVFEPNLLAHGAFVTTDTGLSCFLFAAVFAFYRYVKAPSLWRLALVGLAAGLALAAKHTGVLVFPMLFLLAACEVALHGRQGRGRLALRLAGAFAVATAIAVIVLWSAYGFRYRARPSGLEMNPPFEQFVQQLKPREARTLLALAHWHVLPESYLYGLADVRTMSGNYPAYAFGKVHPSGVWYYFPAAFAIKSTLAFLTLLALTIWAIATRRLNRWREVVFMGVPPVFFLLVTLSAGLNIGVRHILPVYIFLAVLIAGGMASLLARGRVWRYVVAGLLVFHALSSLRSYPTYLAYANEAWGGPANTYKYLTDSNTDWAQQLKFVKQYLDRRGVSNCWFAYFAEGIAATEPYGIPCKALPTISTLWMNYPVDPPATIDGPVLISASSLSGYETGPGALNPYDQFQRLTPTAVIAHGVFVFDGHFDIPVAAGLQHAHNAGRLLGAKQPQAALAEAQAGVQVCPGCVQTETALGNVLSALGRRDEARAAWQSALAAANKLEPEFRAQRVPELERKLSSR